MVHHTFVKRVLMMAILLIIAARVMLSVAAQTQNPPNPQNPANQRPGQNPPGPLGPPRPSGPGGGGGGGFGNAYPQKPQVPPEVVERGKATYSVHCSFCHG